MKPNSDQPTAPNTKLGLKPTPKDDLKSLPPARGGEKIGVVARRPHSGRGAEAADPIWAQTRLRKSGPMPS